MKAILRIAATCCIAGAMMTLVSCNNSNKTDDASMGAVCETCGEDPCACGDANMGVVNDTCPIMGSAVNANAATASYNGHKVGFCCDGCVSKFEAWSDEDKATYVQEAMAGNMGVVGEKAGDCTDCGDCSGCADCSGE